MGRDEKQEAEGFRNQEITKGAAARTNHSKAGARRKVVALQLDEREHAALKYLGGVTGLKKLLCPDKLCIRCRQKAPATGTRFDSLCTDCGALDT
jgi:hypothetical protein